ncbi:unnamed protein product [Angiostrongylus costaricensis]|uniref:G_PROTEIN_RECEP_F1_2 domain-containing protein n=1 Tax=Angiostrongylus costaricensis TaxID=334426 RepID=A0A0R3Q0K1_ANGCS|nr:unnamed protein product [Angiostrongylus costaricensis]
MRLASAAMLEQDHHGLRLREKGTNGICARVRTAREDRPSKYPIPFLAISIALFLTYLHVFFIIGTSVFKEFIAIVDFCATIAPFSSHGLVFENAFWFCAPTDLIAFNYSTYSLSFMILDNVQWITGIKECAPARTVIVI